MMFAPKRRKRDYVTEITKARKGHTNMVLDPMRWDRAAAFFFFPDKFARLDSDMTFCCSHTPLVFFLARNRKEQLGKGGKRKEEVSF